jgi:SAM-dependent methyltransferase
MLARDWYYNQRRQLGLDSAVASIYDRHDDSDLRARAALTMLGVQKGWRLADIGCGNGVLACEAALMGAEVDAIDISPAMLALANIQARDRKVAIRTQPAGMLSFAYQPNSYDLDRQRVHAASSAGLLEGGGAGKNLCGAEARRQFLLARHRVRQHARRHRARCRAVGRFHHQEPRFPARGRRHPYARRILDLRLGDRAHADRCRLHPAIGRLSRAAARHLSPAQAEAGQQS